MDSSQSYLFRNVIGKFNAAGEILILVASATLAIASMSEVAARQSFSGFLSTRIQELQTELIDRYIAIDISGSAISGEVGFAVLETIAFYTAERDKLTSLTTLGAASDAQTLGGIRGRVQDYVSFSGPESSLVSAGEVFPTGVGLSSGFNFLQMLSSEHLLALAVMTCGAIGALVSGMRREQRVTLRNVSLGLAAGFIVYLAVKGGKYVFLLQSLGEDVPFNPYSSAFVGLLAGLFLERAHQFLTSLVDQAVRRVEDVVKKV